MTPDYTRGRVNFNQPPRTVSGMVNLFLDGQGRLTYFLAVPPQKIEAAEPTGEPDWDLLFREAELDRAKI